jgi:acyl-coenzyme A thioesterase PaaI-like protein
VNGSPTLATATTPGPDSIVPQRHPQASAPGTEIGPHYRHCFGCGPQEASGLRMRVVAGAGLTLTASFEVGTAHQGAPGLAHGGILTAALDEALGALNWLLMSPAVTARLETDFRRPVPVGSVLEIEARIVAVDGRKVYTAAEGRLGPGGPVAVAAAGLFLQVELEHFRRHGRAQEVAEAIVPGGARPVVELNP